MHPLIKTTKLNSYLNTTLQLLHFELSDISDIIVMLYFVI